MESDKMWMILRESKLAQQSDKRQCLDVVQHN